MANPNDSINETADTRETSLIIEPKVDLENKEKLMTDPRLQPLLEKFPNQMVEIKEYVQKNRVFDLLNVRLLD